MQFVLIIYHGTSPLPGSAGWNALTEAEQQRMYADYAEINEEPGVTLRLPPVAPGKVTTVRVREGRVESSGAPYLGETSAERSCSKPKTSKLRWRWPAVFRRHEWEVR